MHSDFGSGRQVFANFPIANFVLLVRQQIQKGLQRPSQRAERALGLARKPQVLKPPINN